MLVSRKAMAKMPNTIAARPDKLFVKKKIATTRANDVLMTLSMIPMFCVTVFTLSNYSVSNDYTKFLCAPPRAKYTTAGEILKGQYSIQSKEPDVLFLGILWQYGSKAKFV